MNLLRAPSYKPCGGLGGSTPHTIGIVNIDWLAFSVSLCESSAERDAHEWIFHDAPSGYRLVEFPGTNIYRRRFILYATDGRKILTLLCSPFSRAIPRTSALVEVANEWLYSGFWWMIDLLNDIHPCNFLCFSRVDVCCDFCADNDKLQLINSLAENRSYVQGKRDGSAFFSFSLEGSGVERTPRQLSWGSKNSNIKWKVYNKSLELHEFDAAGGLICHKPYIVAQWESQGWDKMKVWRCEVSICPMRKFTFRDRRLAWKDIINGFTIEDLFVSLYMTRFVIRRNEGHRDKSNDKRVHLLADFGQVTRVSPYVNPNPNYMEVVEYGSCLHAAMVQLAKPEVQVNPAMLDVWVRAAKESVRLGHLEGYFFRQYGCRVEDYNFNLLHVPSS